MGVVNQIRLREGVAPPGNKTRGEGHTGELRAPVFPNLDVDASNSLIAVPCRMHEEWRK